MTIRENILFGKPFYQRFYQDVIEACALREVRVSSSLWFSLSNVAKCLVLIFIRRGNLILVGY